MRRVLIGLVVLYILLAVFAISLRPALALNRPLITKFSLELHGHMKHMSIEWQPEDGVRYLIEESPVGKNQYNRIAIVESGNKYVTQRDMSEAKCFVIRSYVHAEVSVPSQPVCG